MHEDEPWNRKGWLTAAGILGGIAGSDIAWESSFNPYVRIGAGILAVCCVGDLGLKALASMRGDVETPEGVEDTAG